MKTQVKRWLRETMKKNVGSCKGYRVEFKVDYEIEDGDLEWYGDMVFSFNDMVSHLIETKKGWFDIHVTNKWGEWVQDKDCKKLIQYDLRKI
tara:strand:- start:612 stop:887 length:276 start_codon:yes stop_codon:yes gene_type:complete